MLKGLVIKSIHIENGLTYESVDIPLEKQGLVFVRGANYDTDQHRSNGAGKSSFVDILEHVLFESTSRGLDKDEIIRAGSQNGYFAKVALQSGNESYVVEQARKHKDLGTILRIFQEFEHGLEEISPPKNLNKTKQQIQLQLLKMTRQQFHGSVYLSQEAGYPLVTGSGPEISKYLSSTFGFDVYDEIRVRVKATLDEVQERLTKADVYVLALKDIDTKLAEFSDHDYIIEMEKAVKDYLDFGQEQLNFLYTRKIDLSSLKNQAKRREELKEELGEDFELEQAEKTVTKKKKFLTAITNQLMELSAQKSKEEERKKSLEELEVLKTSYESLVDACPEDLLKLCSDNSHSTIIDDLNHLLVQVSSIVSTGNSVLEGKVDPPEGGEDSSVLEEQHRKNIEKFEKDSPSLLSLSSRIPDLLKAINGSVCPTCGQKIKSGDSDEHFKDELAKAKEAKIKYENLLSSKKKSEKYLKSLDAYISFNFLLRI